MKINLGQAVSYPTSEEISALESLLGTRFPSRYVSILKERNGAVPEANVFYVAGQNRSSVNQFIPLDKVAYENRFLPEDIAHDYFPIAYAEGGNYVCLPVAIEDLGVYFVDHELPGVGAVARVAASFDEFLNELQPIDRLEPKLKQGQVKSAWIDPSFLK